MLIKLLFLILLFIPIISLSQDNWLGKDKVLHFTISMTFTTAPIVILEDYNVKHSEIKGALIMFSAGLAKEFLYDSKPSYKDITCNALGCVAGIYLNRLLRKIDHKKHSKFKNF